MGKRSAWTLVSTIWQTHRVDCINSTSQFISPSYLQMSTVSKQSSCQLFFNTVFVCKTYFASHCIECTHVAETACAAPFLSLHFFPLPAVPQSHILISCLSGHLVCIGIGKEGEWPIVIAILAKLLACLGPYVVRFSLGGSSLSKIHFQSMN